MSEFLKVVGRDKEGDKFSKLGVTRLICKSIDNDMLFKARSRNMSKDLENYTHILDSAVDIVNERVDRLIASEDRLKDTVKSISGKIKDSHHKLADGLLKVEKTANFDRLERYVDLLERAESAMSALAELENSGKLDKIAGALK